MNIRKNIKERISRELICEIDLKGIIKDITSNCFKILGYKKEEMINRNIIEFMDEKLDIDILREKSMESIEISLIDYKKNIIYIDTTYKIIDEHNDVRIYLSMIDISKHKKNEENAKRLMSIFEKSKDIIYSLQLVPQIKFNYLSPSVIDNLGYSLEEYYVNPIIPFEIIHPDYKDIHRRKLEGYFNSEEYTLLRFKHKNGKYIWFEEYVAPVYDEKGTLIALEGITRNIQKRKQLEEELENLSYLDSLTGIYNKRFLEKEMNKLDIDVDIKLGIIVCDLDNLKHINDTFGHFEGDMLIKQAVILLSRTLRKEDIIARIGGDEFVILLKNIQEDELSSTYQNINKVIYEYKEKNSKIPIEISIGLAYSESSNGVVKELFKIADANMYAEKNKRKYNCRN